MIITSSKILLGHSIVTEWVEFASYQCDTTSFFGAIQLNGLTMTVVPDASSRFSFVFTP